MVVEYPDSLPLPQHGMTYTTVDPQLRSELQSGRTRVRRRFTAVPVAVECRWVMRNNEQAAAFEAFYKDTLIDGTLWFGLPTVLPQGRENRKAQFMGIYSGPLRLNAPGFERGVWEYTATLQLYSRGAQDGV